MSTDPLRKCAPSRFVEHLRTLDQSSEKPSYALFLGAGCSISSGIPAAGALVRDRWLPMLHREMASSEDFDTWVETICPEHEERGFGYYYSKVIKELFPHEADRQREIEELCDGKFPGFGYAVFSQLIADRHRKFKVVLTTNFDDLMADALYVFTDTKPLLISHESLIHFATPTVGKPIIVKVHGDLRYAPKNSQGEIDTLEPGLVDGVKSLISGRTLIFIGYGGHDPGVNTMLATIRKGEHREPIYWVSRNEPDCKLRGWLQEHEAIWVQSEQELGFDKLALLFKEKFEIPEPDEKRFQKVYSRYTDTYQKLGNNVDAIPDENPEGKELKAALEEVFKTLPDWLKLSMEANHIKNRDRDKADELFQRAMDADPDNAVVLGDYATFLSESHDDHDRAEELYQKALKLTPLMANTFGNYAEFLLVVRDDRKKALNLAKQMLNVAVNEEDMSTHLIAVLFLHILGPKEGMLGAMRALLSRGIRHTEWKFDEVIGWLRKNNEKDADFIDALTKVINNKEPLKSLDAWPQWKKG